MKHSIRELYKVLGVKRPFLATPAFIEEYQIATTRESVSTARLNGSPYAIRATHQQAHKGFALVHCVDSVDMIWMYGEKTWFDTKEERDAYRALKQREG